MLDDVCGASPPFCWRKTKADPPELRRQEEGERNPLYKAETSASEVTLLIMPGAGAQDCWEGEYLHEGHCCLFCPAGTYVAQHCSASHSRGKCVPCTEGESYTAHENGLEECLSCRQCKDDQITLRPCTLTHDAECQCKEGYFCPAEGCEICQRCSTMCPDGKEIVQNCNATTDLGCGSPDQGSTVFVWIPVVILVVAVVLVLLFVIRKLKNAASPDKDAEKGLESEGSTESLILTEVETPANNANNPEDENSGESPEDQAQINLSSEVNNPSPEENSVVLSERGTILPRVWKHHVERCWRRIAEFSRAAKTGENLACQQNALSNVPSDRIPANNMVQKRKYQIIVKDLSQKELRDSFLAFIKEVPRKKWKRLMRTHLPENDIDKIIYDFPNDIEEQCYQMLLTWRNSLGEKQAIIKLLKELRYLDSKAYDNIVNTLKSNNIISKVEVTD
ncbi:PREDICTED: tumor necrosis factor receptor superfamily member 10B-like isoform X2 [Calidris pugnax]|uniref:tumor necrosis factor receptor superfamily member 10B-like isoform X2 n=1 Tax=Calidris pugnax TaxID=198806 RepID=UPI00071D6F64|nr:PREDICTED: tumor necrosis factor receptor superfamily member 10B-like isoform X2 [Calidris pugnax]